MRYIPGDLLTIVVKQHVSSLIEAEAVLTDYSVARVTIDAETGETVSTNVPVGSYVWRRLAKAARNYVNA